MASFRVVQAWVWPQGQHCSLPVDGNPYNTSDIVAWQWNVIHQFGLLRAWWLVSITLVPGSTVWEKDSQWFNPAHHFSTPPPPASSISMVLFFPPKLSSSFKLYYFPTQIQLWFRSSPPQNEVESARPIYLPRINIWPQRRKTEYLSVLTAGLRK